MKNSKSKMIIGAAGLGAAVGAAMMANKLRENNKSQFEKILEQVSDFLQDKL